MDNIEKKSTQKNKTHAQTGNIGRGGVQIILMNTFFQENNEDPNEVIIICEWKADTSE